MKIETIDVFKVEIPFSFSVDHNLKKRQTSESIVLAVRNDTGMVGYGEGAPRDYVTGESVQKMIPLFKHLSSSWQYRSFDSIDDISMICNSLTDKFYLPSFACAMETALLDLLSQTKGQGVSNLLNFDNTFQTPYSGIVPFAEDQQLEQLLQRIKQLNLRKVKVKVGGKYDLQTLTRVREVLGTEIDIRIDANQAWGYEEAVKKITELSAFSISAVEEPINHKDQYFLPLLAKKIDMSIILDESVYTERQALQWSSLMQPEKLIFNLKLSKCGGLMKASKIHKYASSQGITCSLGCNVGETMILSQMGKVFSQTHPLDYLEGSYAPFFMEHDLGIEPISFGQNGHSTQTNEPKVHLNLDLEKLDFYGDKITSIELTSHSII